ncbi:MAG: glycosyltransferase family 2 protein [Spirosomataceae bacterium]
MNLSIIFVNYKTPELIIECLDSVYKFNKNLDFEVIVVNNASKADDEVYVKKHYPTVIWHDMGYNAGFGRANNTGMRIAKGKYFLILNTDTIMIDNSIEKCFNHLENRPDAIAGGAYQLYSDLTSRTFYHTFTFRKDFWIVPPQFRRHLDKIFKFTKFDDDQQVDYIAAAFLMIRREGFEKTGGFDEEFFMYGEDTYFGYQLSKFGKNLLFKDCKIIHNEWGSSPERYNETQSYTYFNRFDPQIQLSNIVWYRKQYGVIPFLLLMIHYWVWVLVFCTLKVILNLSKFKSPFANFDNQTRFAKLIGLFSKYFWKILFKVPTFYKI